MKSDQINPQTTESVLSVDMMLLQDSTTSISKSELFNRIMTVIDEYIKTGHTTTTHLFLSYLDANNLTSKYEKEDLLIAINDKFTQEDIYEALSEWINDFIVINPTTKVCSLKNPSDSGVGALILDLFEEAGILTNREGGN